MDDLLLTRATLFASCNPCSMSRSDMLDLIRMAGFDDGSHIMQMVAAERDGLILTDNAAVKHLVRMAEARAGVPAGNALQHAWVSNRRRMVLPPVLLADSRP